VLLTKADLADPAPLRAALAPKPVIPVSQGRVPLDALLGLGTSGRAAPAPVQAADHADALFQSTVLDCTQPLDPAVFSAAISTLGLTRAKGFFLAPGGTRQQFHLAGARIRITPAPEEGPLGIVCIGLTGQFDPTLCHRAMKDAAYP